jgi:LCP family protein required for cell wall assembly
VWRRTKWSVVASAAAMCAIIAAGGVDLAVLDHRLRHVSVTLPDGGAGQTWLVVGSDARPVQRGPRFAGRRADVILLVHVGAPRSSVISVPRDLLLRTTSGGVERAALTFDGAAQQLVDGLCRTLGVAASHLAIVQMTGFAHIVDAIGGLTVHLAHPIRDREAQLEIDRAGTVHVSGHEALALVRSRRPQHLVDGVWVGTGEFRGARARSRTAATVFTALRARARAVRHDPVTVQRLLWAATGAITLDQGTGLSDLFGLLTNAGRMTVLPAARLPRTIALLADDRTRAVLAGAGYPPTCTPRSAG